MPDVRALAIPGWSPARMRVVPGSRSGRAYTVLTVVVTAAWSVAAVGQTYGLLAIPGPGALTRFLTIAWPLALSLKVLLSRARRNQLDTLILAWVWILGGALFTASHVVSSPSTAFAPAALALVAVAVARYPTAALLVVFAITGSYGSIQAFVGAPTGYTETALLAGIWIGALAGYVFGKRRTPVRPWLGFVALALFLLFSVGELITQTNTSSAIQAFRIDGWYMAGVLAICISDWPREVFWRAAKGVTVIALLVGAYAVFRLIVGPAKAEAALIGQSTYNFVDGKPKLAGSLGGGNALGIWTATMIPFCTAMVLGERGRWRLIGAASVALCAIALFASQTRAGALGVLAGLLLVILLHQGSRAFRGLRMGTTIAAVAFLVGAGTAGFALSGDSGATTHKYSALFDPNSDQSVVQRRIKWDQALNDLRGYPFGYGIGTSTSGFARGVVSTRFYLNVGARSIDNGYLKVALEQGLVAMGFYIAAFVLFIGGLSWFAVTTSDRRQATIALGGAGALLSLAVLLIAGAFTEGPTALAVWVVAGMGGAMVTRRGAAEEAPVAKDPSVLPAAQT